MQKGNENEEEGLLKDMYETIYNGRENELSEAAKESSFYKLLSEFKENI